jgi:glutamyl-tRNA synthetase
LLQEKGYLPEAVVNFIAILGWTPPSHHSSSAHQPEPVAAHTQKDDNDEKANSSISSAQTNNPQEIFSLNELVEQFNLEGLNKRPLTVSKKLLWMNKKHFKRKLEDGEELHRLALRLQQELRQDHDITKW